MRIPHWLRLLDLDIAAWSAIEEYIQERRADGEDVESAAEGVVWWLESLERAYETEAPSELLRDLRWHVRDAYRRAA